MKRKRYGLFVAELSKEITRERIKNRSVFCQRNYQ